MRVLFVMRHPGYVRNFESAIGEMASRGHSVHVSFDGERAEWLKEFNPIDPLAERHENVTYGRSPGRRDHRRRDLLARGLRLTRDYLRYFEPEFRDAPRLRARAGRKLPRILRELPGLRHRTVRRPLDAVVKMLERALPRDPVTDAFIAEQRPDVVLVTPLVSLGAEQVDYLRSAHAFGIPAVLPVTSWDNLTNKGLIHGQPDLVLVWNEAQRREAIDLHGIAAERVVVTGAHSYDHWFRWQPSSRRDEFSRRVGLPADRPFLLYVCSSRFVAHDEVPFVRRWLERLRAADPPLAEAGVLVRPHPQNFMQWKGVELDARAVIWPPSGADPVDDRAKSDYFDSIHHCAAVVGLNTSALIESAIIGRSVHTILAPEFRETQLGTLHFEHIAGSRGLLHVATDLDDHVGALIRTLGRGKDRSERNDAFLRDFVRPYGVDVEAAPLFVDAVERLVAEWRPTGVGIAPARGRSRAHSIRGRRWSRVGDAARPGSSTTAARPEPR